MTTKADKIKQYNQGASGYNITGIKKMTSAQVEGYRRYGEKDLHDLYKNPSVYKINSWNKILTDYSPIEIIGVQGSCHSYSVLLVAENGDTLHITKDNNYLVEVQA